ncbi:transcription termination factor MTERF5, chloroplastic-like [Cornus florida]|uniref:transcription termination factor MTERF5, chloroplastic-like n=1 Tax=Cornus florida TaxID=4283 RepID=UPI002898245F|nr:transcription termination factor MTERF5, chloroplastic-like [Cornus florida]XP_059629431.1 transcription termination factor MTERF5, chloroplastic-like [Cornus florida]
MMMVRFNNLYSKPIIPFLSFFSSVSSLNRPRTQTSPPIPNPCILNYLLQTFHLSEPRALSICNRFSRTKTLEKPQVVVQFLKQQLGFSDAHIRSAVRIAPQILFSDIDKTLKPKLQFFQEMGVTGPDLSKIISRNSLLLTCSLDRKLKPCIEIFKKILINDDKNRDLVLVLRRCTWVASKEPVSKLLCNIAFLHSCGIFGPQLSMLLKRQPRLFLMKESVLRNLVSRVVDLGFSIGSRMLVHAIYTVSCMSSETFARKFELFGSFGFSKDESMEMFRRAPGLLRTSEDKLKIGIEFYMDILRLKKSVLVHRPAVLMSSMEERVIPRYRVLQILKSKRLLKKEPSFLNVLDLLEGEFLENYISRFEKDVEELLVAYKGHFLDSSEE